MKKYVYPTMNISVFDTEDVITTSGGLETYADNAGASYGSVSYSSLQQKTNEVSQTVAIN